LWHLQKFLYQKYHTCIHPLIILYPTAIPGMFSSSISFFHLYTCVHSINEVKCTHFNIYFNEFGQHYAYVQPQPNQGIEYLLKCKSSLEPIPSETCTQLQTFRHHQPVLAHCRFNVIAFSRSSCKESHSLCAVKSLASVAQSKIHRLIHTLLYFNNSFICNN
jgi:hypothetical protein